MYAAPDAACPGGAAAPGRNAPRTSTARSDWSSRSSSPRLLSRVDGPTLPSVATGTAALPLGTADGLRRQQQRARGSGRHGTMGRAAAWRGTKPTPRAAGCPGARPTATPIHGCGPQRGRGAAQAHAAAGAVPLCCLRRRGRRDAAFKLILCWARAHGQHMRVEAAQGSKPAPALRRPRRAKAVAAAAAAGVAERGRCSPARGAAAQES